MSFGSRDYYHCHHIQRCGFQPITKANPIGDLNYLFSQLKQSVAALTESVAALTPSYGSFYNVTTTAGTGQTLALYSAAVPSNPANAVTFSNASITNTSDITFTGGNTITVNTTGVYEIDYSLLMSASDSDTTAGNFAQFGLRIVTPGSTTPTLPVQSFQSYNLSVTATLATGETVAVAQCIPIDASFQLQLTAGSTVQLINLSPTAITLCNGVNSDATLNAVNARINFERLSPIAS